MNKWVITGCVFVVLVLVVNAVEYARCDQEVKMLCSEPVEKDGKLYFKCAKLYRKNTC
jgi:hypothetical protein